MSVSKLLGTPAGSSAAFSLRDIRRCCCVDEPVTDESGVSSTTPMVQVSLLVELALRRFRTAGQPLTRAEGAALAAEYSLLRSDEATGELVASTPLHGFPLTWWTTVAMHSFLLVPLAEVVGRAASEAIRNAFSTPGRHGPDSTAKGHSTSLRRTEMKERQSVPMAGASPAGDAPAVALSLASRLSEPHGALLDAPVMPMMPPQHIPTSREVELLNDGIARSVVPIPEAVEHLLCPGCRRLHLRVVQMQCCGSCQCWSCAHGSVSCVVCGEDSAEVGAPAEYPERCATVRALARELMPMYRTELGADRAGRGILQASDAVLATPSLFR